MPQTTKAPRSVARSQLGARLAELRSEAELTLAEAARRAQTDTGTLSRVENGLRGLKPKTAERLLDCYGVSDEGARNEVFELIRVDAARRRRPSWWQRHREVLSPTQFDGYLALEANACAIRNFESYLVPGLLQTPEYAREVIAVMRPELRLSQVNQLVDVRLARQRKLFENDTDFAAIIDEGAFHRRVGSSDIMRAQLEQLIEASAKPKIAIRLTTFSLGLHPGLTGSFVVMSFPSAARDIVWVETLKRSLYFEDADDVEGYTEVFSNLWERALTPDATRARIKEAIKEL